MLSQMAGFPSFYSWIIFHCICVCVQRCVYVCIFFIHSSVDGHLGYFHILPFWIMLQWIWWGSKYPLKIVILFPYDLYPDVGLLDNMIALFLIFWGNSILFSKVAALIYVPTSSAQGFPFFHILITLVISCHFDNSHFNTCELVSHCDFDLYLPDD